MISRRQWLAGSAGGAGAALWAWQRPSTFQGEASRVAVVRAGSYSEDLADLITRGLRECRIDVRGKRVLVKPNLVEFCPDAPVHTDAAVLAGCVAALEACGASEVLVGEGPGHRRDTLGMAESAGYRQAVPGFDRRFTDLNLDDVAALTNVAGQPRFYFPRAVLGPT